MKMRRELYCAAPTICSHNYLIILWLSLRLRFWLCLFKTVLFRAFEALGVAQLLNRNEISFRLPCPSERYYTALENLNSGLVYLPRILSIVLKNGGAMFYLAWIRAPEVEQPRPIIS